MKFLKKSELQINQTLFDFINKEANGSYDLYDISMICDTYFLSKIFLYDLHSYKLQYLCDYFKINLDNIHRAEDDAINSAKLFLKLLDVIGEININNLRSLNRCLKHSNKINRKLLNNIIRYYISKNKNNSNNNRLEKNTGNFHFTNKSLYKNKVYDIKEIFL